MNGMNPKQFYDKLAQNTPTTVQELMRLVENYTKGEEVNTQKREIKNEKSKTKTKAKAIT